MRISRIKKMLKRESNRNEKKLIKITKKSIKHLTPFERIRVISEIIKKKDDIINILHNS